MARNITITFADGSTHVYQGVPDQVTPDQVQARAEREFVKTVKAIDGGAKPAAEPIEHSQGVSQNALNLLAGGIRGAGSIGATAMRVLPNFLGGDTAEENAARRQSMDEALQSFGAQPDSWMYKGGKLGTEVMGTAGAGNLLAKPFQALAASRFGAGVEPVLDGIVKGLQTGGFRVGELAGTRAGAATRLATGAATGGLSAGIVDPKDAAFGATVGGALPAAAKLAGKTGAAIRNKVAGDVAPEVVDLANRAKQLGIDIPADRLIDSKPLNAVAAGLNYIPFSGRAATEDLMNAQLNRAASRTFGQDSANITQALRRANDQLGAQFEHTLRNNGVKFDQQFLTDVATVYNKAEAELGSDALKPIASKVNDLIEKGQSGLIDGQAAYNIKRELDRIGRGNTPTAFHALELKGVLMDALNRSLGPAKAEAFAQTRKQYGNMLALEKLAKNGADGEISVARLANMKNINNAELQELADIAAQFVKPREGQHGAAQRAFAGLAAAGLAGVPAAVTAAATGRATNAALNSQGLKDLLLKGAPAGEPDTVNLLTRGVYRTAPLLSPDR